MENIRKQVKKVRGKAVMLGSWKSHDAFSQRKIEKICHDLSDNPIVVERLIWKMVRKNSF